LDRNVTIDRLKVHKISVLFEILVGLGLSTSFLSCQDKEVILSVPHAARWGIYALYLEGQEVELIASASQAYAFLNLSNSAERLLFSQKINSTDDLDQEICSIQTDGKNFRRLTNNHYLDLYPAFSPEDTAIVFLSSRGAVLNLDLYIMAEDGSNERLFWDSGSHDADVHWVGAKIVFTANSRIWSINVDGTYPVPLTDPPQAGEWGAAPYPMGDYDPRLSPDGQKVAFSRMVDSSNPHGGYDIFVMNLDGSELLNLTNSANTQGLVSWSHTGNELVYIVAAVGTQARYDIYQVDVDGSNPRNLTPDYFPDDFLCHSAVFALNDTKIYFVGEWWE
jgi:Tol biopolymer transport system component